MPSRLAVFGDGDECGIAFLPGSNDLRAGLFLGDQDFFSRQVQPSQRPPHRRETTLDAQRVA